MKNRGVALKARRIERWEGSLKQDALSSQSMDFAVAVFTLVSQLRQDREYIVSSQLGRSGTSIGANIREAQFAQSKADFVSKLQIALKEAHETRYWLELLLRAGSLDSEQYKKLDDSCASLVSMLVSSIKTAKQNSNPSPKGTP